MSEAPDPPVPPEVDLRDYPYTPIFRARLFGSSFHARTSDAEWRAGVTLWLRSWDQVPAGSLPDDEIDLCRLAELGRDLKEWRKLREGALRGWTKCKDGRLYHLVVAEGVLEAWNKRSSAKRRGSLGAEKRWLSHEAAIAEPSKGNGKTNEKDSKEREVEVKGKGKSTPLTPLNPDWLPEEWRQFEQHRVEKRSKLTPTAKKACIAKLERWRTEGRDIVAILRYSIDNGYTGLFEEKGGGAKPNRQQALEQGNAAVAERWRPPE